MEQLEEGGSMERLTTTGTKEANESITIREMINKLAEYEDLEEQGLLLKLPCAESDYTKMYKRFYDFGKTVFLTKEEAEAALHIQGENNG